MRATASSWNHLPPPADRVPLELEAEFTASEAEQLMVGLVPDRMEDKWFIYFDEGWLRFHRSWTGAFIYALRLEGSPAGMRVTESWVSRNSEQYGASDVAYDRRLVRFLIDAFLLKKANVSFPMPAGARRAPRGIIQHSLVGRGYPESPPEGDA